MTDLCVRCRRRRGLEGRWQRCEATGEASGTEPGKAPTFCAFITVFFPLLTLGYRLNQGKWLLDVTGVGRSATETTKCTQLTAESLSAKVRARRDDHDQAEHRDRFRSYAWCVNQGDAASLTIVLGLNLSSLRHKCHLACFSLRLKAALWAFSCRIRIRKI